MSMISLESWEVNVVESTPLTPQVWVCNFEQLVLDLGQEQHNDPVKAIVRRLASGCISCHQEPYEMNAHRPCFSSMP